MTGLISLDFFDGFLEKTVQLRSGGYKLVGKLKAAERLSTDRHPPLILILENLGNVSIIRGCQTVGIVKQPKPAKEAKI